MLDDGRTRILYHGDNIDFLKALDEESIDLIVTDPPFNKGRDFKATPESLKKDKGGGSRTAGSGRRTSSPLGKTR